MRVVRIPYVMYIHRHDRSIKYLEMCMTAAESLSKHST